MTRTFRAVDLFAGAGGTSTGLALAAEAAGIRIELAAINHWETAVATHAANHAWASHYCEAIDSLDPRKVAKEGLDLLVASPECTHHSHARGGRPMSDQSRATAWCVLRWADALRPRVILVENVRELETWGPLTVDGRPMKSRVGETYQAWLAAIRSLGYRVESRVICAADHGDPTTRRRLFVLAWRGRGQAPWALATHAKAGGRDLFGSLEPWRAARSIIDWSLPGASIFERKKPLAAKTMARIEEGLRRFRGLSAFVLQQQSGGAPREVSEPLPTLATRGAVSLVEPFLVRYQGTGGAESIDRPLPTITTRDRFGLVEPMQLDVRFRMLAPHELAAAMSFPVGYRFSGNRGEVIRQIGNAVPVSTARSLCSAIIEGAA